MKALETEDFRTLIDYAVSRGLEIEYEIHAARHLLPASLFETHPEHFRMNADGKRTAKMAHLAHRDTLTVPSNIVPEKVVFLEYAPIEKYKDGDEILIKAEREALLKQSEFFGFKDSKVLEYRLDNSLFSGWKKPPKRFSPDNAQIKKEVAEYAALGFETVATFGCFLGDDYEELYGEPDISGFTE